MKNVVVFIALVFAIIGGVLLLKDGETTVSPVVQDAGRTGTFYVENDRADQAGAPYIISAQLLTETSEKLIFEVVYFMPDNISGSYSLSVHPDMSHWYQSMNSLRPGTNTELVSIGLNVKVGDPARVESHLMNLYINHYEDRSYVGKVFDRKIPFQKIWEKQ
ncbi:MAG: hypothetical protein ACRBDL_08735 [Alphaproteobacteria bacterium]